MSSASFKIPSDVISVGGGRSTSTSYIVEDTLGEDATGEGMEAVGGSYKLCAGFQCMAQASFLSFSIKEGTSSPGSVGAGVALGTISPLAVSTSNGTTINSIFITAESSAGGGTVIQVKSSNAGLKSISSPTTVVGSATASLVAGTPGYGVCVQTATSLTKTAPYNGTCDKTTGHDVGIVDGTVRTMLSSSGYFTGGAAEILVKAAVSTVTPGLPDYADTLTFTLTSTY